MKITQFRDTRMHNIFCIVQNISHLISFSQCFVFASWFYNLSSAYRTMTIDIYIFYGCLLFRNAFIRVGFHLIFGGQTRNEIFYLSNKM